MNKDSSTINESLLEIEKVEIKEARLTPFGTFITLIKGYCCLTLLLVPKAYSNGGYIFSPCAQITSFIITSVCSIKLAQTALDRRVFNYSDIVTLVLGRQAGYL